MSTATKNTILKKQKRIKVPIKKNKKFSISSLGNIFGAIAGFIVGYITSPKIEAEKRDELEKAAKKLLKQSNN